MSGAGARVVLLGYSDIGAACLEELVAAGADVALVVTHDDAPGETVWFRSVAEVARSRGIRVIAPADANDPRVVATIREAAPDFLISAMFRQMLKAELLGIPSRAALNLHPSRLPRFRGRSPINWVLVMGEPETGVTLHHMVEKPDRGDIVAQRTFAIAEDDTALSLHRKATAESRLLVRETFPALVAGTAPRIAQDQSQASYYGGRKPADGEIDWRLPARRIYDLVRAVTHPFPGAFSWHGGRKLLVWWARPLHGEGESLGPGEVALNAAGSVVVGTGDGVLRLERVAPEGEAEIDGPEWAAARGIRPGEFLGRAS